MMRWHVCDWQAREQAATTCTALFDDLTAQQLMSKYGKAWPEGCVARALQTPLTHQWGNVSPLPVSRPVWGEKEMF